MFAWRTSMYAAMFRSPAHCAHSAACRDQLAAASRFPLSWNSQPHISPYWLRTRSSGSACASLTSRRSESSTSICARTVPMRRRGPSILSAR